MSAETPFLAVESLGLALGEFRLDDVSLSLARGEHHILLGPSGSGKSTLMRCILGFHRPDKGRILLAGREITDELPERRRMGYVPQSYALFPHLTVEENIRFGMRAHGMAASEADPFVDELTGMLGITRLRARAVRNLSGGEQQKVALARALGTRPETVLLDEPFSSIDEGARRGLWFELKQVIEKVGITALHITHNLEEAETLGKRISVLIGGRLTQHGDKEAVFEQPANEQVARFLGFRNIFKGPALAADPGTRIDLGAFALTTSAPLTAGEEACLCVRGQDVKIIKEGMPVRDELKRNLFTGRLVRLAPLLDTCLAWFKVDGSDREFDLEIRFPRHIRDRYGLEPGKQVTVAIWEPKIIVL